MSIITAGFEHGTRNAIERRAKKRAAEMAREMAPAIAREMAEERAQAIAREMAPEITRIVALDMVWATARVAAEKAAKDQAQQREAFIKFMRSKGIPEEEIDAFIRQLPPQGVTAGA